ncbi:putative carboxypeptidase C [Lupinus albus]|uniref:Putative carboxypeptidase C n=1 Tax=Lupinus albus TaxID=3870 RepID=A0A6A4QWW2_LUPAL|nr:putative carboxypeptidase C [Lupinus albus]
MYIKFYNFGSGDHDMCIPFTGSQAWTRAMGYKIVDDWRPWLVDDQVAGRGERGTG